MESTEGEDTLFDAFEFTNEVLTHMKEVADFFFLHGRNIDGFVGAIGKGSCDEFSIHFVRFTLCLGAKIEEGAMTSQETPRSWRMWKGTKPRQPAS